jgi:hypothetical protein
VTTLCVASAIAQENMAKAEECQSRLRTVNEAGFLRDMKLGRRVVDVVVDRGAWARVDFQTKLGFAEAIRCVVTLGDPTKTVAIDIREHIDGRVVHHYTGSRLEAR